MLKDILTRNQVVVLKPVLPLERAAKECAEWQQARLSFPSQRKYSGYMLKKSLCTITVIYDKYTVTRKHHWNSLLCFNSVLSLNTFYVLIIFYVIFEHRTHSKHQRITTSKIRHWGFIFASALQGKCVFFSLFRARCPHNRLQWIQLSNKPRVLLSHAKEIKIFGFLQSFCKESQDTLLAQWKGLKQMNFLKIAISKLLIHSEPILILLQYEMYSQWNLFNFFDHIHFLSILLCGCDWVVPKCKCER